MIPWDIVASAAVPGGGTLQLARRGDEWTIRVDGRDLMRSAAHGSEEALADLGCAPIRDRAAPHVLVGGLGMGYTLAAALRTLPQATVLVAEIVPEVVEWNRGPLAPLAGRPLDDPRATVEVGDVTRVIARSAGAFDAILLDLDNGPAALSHPANRRLYSERGLASAKRALRPGGVLATWSAGDDELFTGRLGRAGFVTRVHRVAAHGTRGRRHVIWIARTGDPG